MNFPSEAPVPRRRRAKGLIARNLRKAAERIIARERLENVTIRRLTLEVGCSSPNFYNHYKGLDGLLGVIAAGGFDELTSLSERTFAAHDAISDALVATAAACMEFYVQRPELARLMFRHHNASGSSEYRAAVDRMLATLARLIADAGATPDEPQLGIARGFLALWYGAAAAAADGLFHPALTDEHAIADFAATAVRPFLDGSAVGLVNDAESRCSRLASDRAIA